MPEPEVDVRNDANGTPNTSCIEKIVERLVLEKTPACSRVDSCEPPQLQNDPAILKYLAKRRNGNPTAMTELPPKRIVEALDKYIIGQADAKRAVAIAIRNRWRRQQLPDAMRDEVGPKNILMIGPTGVGKTEIARRLASLVNAPFLKVEATKFTEGRIVL